MKNKEEIEDRELIKECVFKTSRSGGAGGQHVNKVETKVELWFDIVASNKLTDDEKKTLLTKLNRKLEKNRLIHLQEQSERTQLKNKQLIKDKFYALILSGFKVLKSRQPTKISKAMKVKRLETKMAKSETKKLRKKII